MGYYFILFVINIIIIHEAYSMTSVASNLRTCPTPKYTMDQCAVMLFPPSSCRDDSGCSDSKKCCSNGCVMNCEDPQVSTVVTKPGSCPVSSGPGICAMMCDSDTNCRGILKCCRTSCGGTTCMEPVYPVKDGYCPILTTTPENCNKTKFEPCKHDYTCRENLKCCNNGCGYSCMKPIFNKHEKCPAPYVHHNHCPKIKLPSCYNDTSCHRDLKCCDTGCGKSCIAPDGPKYGKCPLPTFTKDQCLLIKYKPCGHDSKCDGNDKCCYNGCGLACVSPVISKPGSCRKNLNNIQCIRNVCKNDWDCRGSQLCCGNGCLCADPIDIGC